MHCWFVWFLPGTSAPLVKFVKMSRNFLLEFVSWNYYWSLPKINTRATTQARPSTIQILHSHYCCQDLSTGGTRLKEKISFWTKQFRLFLLLINTTLDLFRYFWSTSTQSFAWDYPRVHWQFSCGEQERGAMAVTCWMIKTHAIKLSQCL